MRAGYDRGMQQDDQRLLKSAQTYGPTKSASFGETANGPEDDRERWTQDYRKHTTAHYAPKQTFTDNPTSTERRLNMADSSSKGAYGGVQQPGYQPMTLESNNRRY